MVVDLSASLVAATLHVDESLKKEAKLEVVEIIVKSTLLWKFHEGRTSCKFSFLVSVPVVPMLQLLWLG